MTMHNLLKKYIGKKGHFFKYDGIFTMNYCNISGGTDAKITSVEEDFVVILMLDRSESNAIPLNRMTLGFDE